MSTGRGGNRGMRGGRGGGGIDNSRGRGVWRGGPPPGSGSISRGASPAMSNTPPPAPRQSINDQ
ncbi:hypothetical protein L486_04810 [Kwoniella mangroviensis CBS 10435]|uniref:Uncharacterized protein n=1 Tax=Kwoniella mangroviensis CBS 10435 TaxID=1331196 RepID=A0A1B9IP77_9TREE|nr:uncharacterized protein I203_00450 [Kwoniella mangroviensis CBS 8507]OCF57353.1 hypothetical protein L486_04810 [Kwoniella mangroviensis CBS 10435]OCF70317.1 hypothetical protein I203_00450 [Kwoniella mangroviensis CBS 8507]OCF76092.1 hypothetical protein I204_03390 [Kwoniella mangroviensis CBS 8886]